MEGSGGGAIAGYGSTMFFNRCNFTKNLVARTTTISGNLGVGGAISCTECGTLVVGNSTISGNKLVGSRFGSVSLGGALYFDGYAIALQNSIFSENSIEADASAVGGAAICGTFLLLLVVLFYLFCFGKKAIGVYVAMDNVSIVDNFISGPDSDSVRSYYGVGIFGVASVSMGLNGVSIKRNYITNIHVKALVSGGGAFLQSVSLFINSSSFSDNYFQNGLQNI